MALFDLDDKERYRKVSTRMWGDEKFRALSKPGPNGQSLWQFLITGPCTTPIPGFVVGGPATLAEWLEWPVEGFLEAFREASSKDMVHADWKARLVWLPNAVYHNEPESPNVVRSWRKTWPQIPECNLKWTGYRALLRYCEAKGKGFREAFREAFPPTFGEPSLNQEQEQEQEQEKEVLVAKQPATQPVKPEAPRTGQQHALAIPADSPRGRGHTGRGHTKGASDGSSEHRLFVEWWVSRFEALFGERYDFSGGKDGRHVKDLLAKAGGLEALKRRAEAFLTSDDPWYADKGRDLGLFRAAWNRLASAGKSASKPLSPYERA